MAGTKDTETVDQSILGDSLTFPFSKRVAKSRFLKGAMTERLSSWDQHDPTKRGTPSKELIEVYRQWGLDDFGVILSGNLLVNTMDLEAPGNPIFSADSMSDEKRERFAEMVKAAKANGSLFVAQLSHAGRQVAEFIQPNPVSASDIKLDDRMGMSFAKPKALTLDGIKKVIEEFAFAAVECKKAGFDGIQLHSAHGYLLAQFLAESTNKRTDQYGGNLENRSRIIFEIIDEIKKRVNDSSFILSMKLNSVEFQTGGFDTKECAELCKNLEAAGLDFIELSGGTYESLAFKRQSSAAREAFFLDFAEVIRPALKKTIIYVTGGFRTGKVMVDAVKEGSTDGIGLARPVCAETTICRDLISNKVHHCAKTLLEENDFGITNVAAGTQIAQIGRKEKPFDVTNEKAVRDFQAKVNEFFGKMGEEQKNGIVSAGYPIIHV